LTDAFLLQKRVSGCTDATLRAYGFWLERLSAEAVKVTCLDAVALTRFFSGLRERGVSSSTIHQAYRTLKTFCRWCIASGTMAANPLAGLRIRTPKTLPQVPTEDELRAVLACCGETFEGRRNRALILVLADAGLRAAEILRLIVEDWSPGQRSLFVRGKGGKDRVTFLSPTTARAVRDYLAIRRVVRPEDHLFVTRHCRPLKTRHLAQILHRLSAKAGLPGHRRFHPHALRHLAATTWLRHGMGLDEVRRLLGHASLQTTLRYSSLVSADVQRAHRKAAAIERMGLD
jgi:integrase/recombinase XerD